MARVGAVPAGKQVSRERTRDRGAGARYRRSRQLVLDAVRREGGATRVDVQRLTGLSRSAVASAVADLLAARRLVEQHPAGPSVARGRPAGVLVAVDRAGPVAGIDIGHAHVAVAVCDTAGELQAERRAEVDVDRDPAAAFDAIESLVAVCTAAAGVATSDLLAVAAGIPGPIGAGTDAVRSQTILAGWTDVHPARELGRRLGVPVSVGNDADLGARGELRFGAGRGLRDFLYVKASHGIGAGLVLGGRSYRGAVGIAGEIGHSRVPGALHRCRCGNVGCLETVVSVDALRRRLFAPPGSRLPDLVRDAESRRVVADAGRTIGRVLADLCNCLNPQAVLVGGEVGALGTPLVGGIREAIDRWAQPASARAVTVRQAQLGDRAEVLGAAWTAIEQARQLT